ncbi:FAD-dependent oxidoreductase [Desulfoscipio gibsoniae]|uniref:Thioredoxin reductase n=1 Tax=Desulfoscipio gibsoniae DSM 7213 TaxID=767817 RepID=R4KRQ3_9FIRM|nr:FAD-dependent oxidoreductase [Desulfoscipio gibsoniae]AGL02286.1 thioredoxin reductase [Desulfoscipio gibsoniae DSM 7213]
MKRYEVIVIGAGPAGLSAAIEAASHGMQVVVFDENARPGGQLFKQIHKFFGSKEHKAKERGFHIGEKLLKEAQALGVEVVLQATVLGIFDGKEISVMIKDRLEHYRANDLIIATGASENSVPFPGWTLPGVIGAGAAQTMMNIHGLKPGNRVLMVGSGNVGLVVGYQLLQAGCQLAAVIDVTSRIGGYGVHAAKVARTGVPFLMSHTIKEACGTTRVEGATIIQVDGHWQPVPGSEKHLEVDTICLAVGLSPMSQLARMSHCWMENNSGRGGMVPICNEYGETSLPGVYAVGDVAGIEEASSAMIQGRVAGAAVARARGYLGEAEFKDRYGDYHSSLGQLREGMFGHKNKGRTDLTHTEEGYALSRTLLARGYLAEEELAGYSGVCSGEKRKNGVFPIIECTQNIPCNPCRDACKQGCIKVSGKITNLPVVDESVSCTGCGMCVVSCPGQAIFLVDESYAPGYAAVSIPYEFYPLPEVGARGSALDRSGAVVGEAEVIGVKITRAMDETAVLTMKVPLDCSMKARFFKPL